MDRSRGNLTGPELLARALDWCAAGHKVAIATVAGTWGSAPRPVGSHLVVREDGLFEGSVSGGCVEGDVILAAQDLLADPDAAIRVLDYGVGNARAWEVGLACGGQIRIAVQTLAPESFSEDMARSVLQAIRAHTACALVIDLQTGRTSLTDAASLPKRSSLDGAQLSILYEPPRRIAIIGAVHISQALAPMAALLGYAPTIIDPRGLFAQDARFEGADMRSDWPDEALDAWRIDASSAVVCLTHDPKLDDPALMRALRSDAFYIAALGSRKTHAARVERLQTAGFSDAEIARIHAPAGLAIGAQSPAEIAASVCAQMIAAHRLAGTAA